MSEEGQRRLQITGDQARFLQSVFNRVMNDVNTATIIQEDGSYSELSVITYSPEGTRTWAMTKNPA